MFKSRLLFFLIFTAFVSAGQDDTSRKAVPIISTSQNTEFAPTISADGRIMIFESDVDKNKGWELFESRLDDSGNWSQPVPIKNINEKCNFLAGPGLSYDGNTLYFTAFIEGVTTTEDIYFSERLANDAWSEPKSVGAPVNTEDGYEGFPSISADGNSLYFIRVNEENSYNKKNKENCFKIFVSQRNADGTWSEPVALPAPINLGCERDPKIMADNHTLVFSSIRPGGKGKYDLYQSRKQLDGSWSDPVSLDFINAEENDQSPCISAAGNVMFFYNLKDIYSVTIPEQYRQMINVTVKGTVKAEKTSAPLRAQIMVKTDSAGEAVMENSAVDGQYSLVLAAGHKYHVQFVHNDYVGEFLNFDFEKQDQYLEVKKDVLLKSEYSLRLTVADKDLKAVLPAHLQVTGDEILFNDSVKSNGYPVPLTLQAGRNYGFKAAALLFPEVTKAWTFDPKSMKEEMMDTLFLVHEKVRYVADVTNIVSKQKTRTKVFFNNTNADEVIVADAGNEVYLRKGDRYQVMTSSDKGYFYSSAQVVAGEGQLDEKGNYSVNLTIIPVVEGAQLTLNYITFPSNSAELDESSFLELDHVIELLQKNPNITVEISAHTDDVGNDDYNLRLSEKRAMSVADYLTKKGTSMGRMRPIGFGESKPLLPNDSEENRSKNRRVELRVLKAS